MKSTQILSRFTAPLTLTTLALFTPISAAELVVFNNTNQSFSTMSQFVPNGANPTIGDVLDLTQDAFNQPTRGAYQTSGSLLFMHTTGLIGDFIWLGTGTVTNTAQTANPTYITDPFAGLELPYFGPVDFSDGTQINATSNFVDGWRPIHGVNELTDPKGVFTVDEVFTVGVQFQLNDGFHYGFAQFSHELRLDNGELKIDLHPLQWGYETIAGVGVSVIPAPSAFSIAMLGLLGCSFRNRR